MSLYGSWIICRWDGQNNRSTVQLQALEMRFVCLRKESDLVRYFKLIFPQYSLPLTTFPYSISITMHIHRATSQWSQTTDCVITTHHRCERGNPQKQQLICRSIYRSCWLHSGVSERTSRTQLIVLAKSWPANRPGTGMSQSRVHCHELQSGCHVIGIKLKPLKHLSQ